MKNSSMAIIFWKINPTGYFVWTTICDNSNGYYFVKTNSNGYYLWKIIPMAIICEKLIPIYYLWKIIQMAIIYVK